MTNPTKTATLPLAPRAKKLPALIDIRQALYLPRYAATVVAALLRPHRPRLDSQATATLRCRAGASTIERWQRFAGHQPHHLPVPFTYLNSAGAFCLAQIMKWQRINFARVMHQKACIEVVQPTDAIAAGEIYTLNMRLKELIPLKQKALLVTATDIVDAHGQTLRRHTDYWHVRGTPTDLATPPPAEALEFRRLSQRPPTWHTWNPSRRIHTRFHLPHDAARRYARVAGDYTPHATAWGARLFGQARPFMQGFGLMNLVLHHLTQALGRELTHLEIVFTRPALTKQQIDIHACDEGFEVCGEAGDLIAFGSFLPPIAQDSPHQIRQ